MKSLPPADMKQSLPSWMKSDAVKVISGVFIVFLFIILWTIEISFINGTFEASSLLMRSLLFAAVVGLGLGYLISRYGDELLEKVQYFVMVLVLSMLIIPLLVSMSNHIFAGSESPQTFEFLKEEPYGTSRFGTPKGQEIKVEGYFIFFVRNYEFERITSSKSLFSDKQKGDMIQLPVRKGLWGYDLVTLEN